MDIVDTTGLPPYAIGTAGHERGVEEGPGTSQIDIVPPNVGDDENLPFHNVQEEE